MNAIQFSRSPKPLARLKHALFHLTHPKVQRDNHEWNEQFRRASQKTHRIVSHGLSAAEHSAYPKGRW